MQRRYRVRSSREPQSEHGHTERLIQARILASQAHKTFLRKADCIAERPEVLFDRIRFKAIVARRHRSVSYKYDFTRHARHRTFESDPFVFHAHANGFQNCEAAVSFVEVEHAGLDPQLSQGAQPSHPKQQLLPNANAAISTVQTRSQLSVFGMIAFDVGVEQKQIAAPDFYAPHFCTDGTRAGVDLHHYRKPVLADGRFHRQLADVGLQILFMLPATAIQSLAEVALSIKQPYAD